MAFASCVTELVMRQSVRIASVVLMNIALACLGGDARACPNCEPGRQARQEFWDDGFMVNLVAATLPLLVVLVVGECARELGRRRGAGHAEQGSRTKGSETPASSPSTLRGA